MTDTLDRPTTTVRPGRRLSDIALQPTRETVLRRTLEVAREAWGADGAFAAGRRPSGVFPADARIGLDEPCWADVTVQAGRGLGGRVLQDRRLRTSDDYVRDLTITPDYVPIMRREAVHATAVVPIEDLADGTPAALPAALLYVTSHGVGAPGDRVLEELLRIADMAAVGLAHLAALAEARETAVPPDPSGRDPGPAPRGRLATSAASATATPLTPRELELLGLLDAGRSNRQIADELVISPSTVKAHLGRIYGKLEVPGRLAAVAAGRRSGLL